MKLTEQKDIGTITYKFGNTGYFVDVVWSQKNANDYSKNGNMNFEAYLYNKEHDGYKMYMFGGEHKSLADFVEAVQGNILEGNCYADQYEKEMEILEEFYEAKFGGIIE